MQQVNQLIEGTPEFAQTAAFFNAVAYVTGLDHDRVIDAFECFTADELRQITDAKIGAKMVMEQNTKHVLEVLERMTEKGIKHPPADFSQVADLIDQQEA